MYANCFNHYTTESTVLKKSFKFHIPVADPGGGEGAIPPAAL